MWIFKPFSDLKKFSHWSHLKTLFSTTSSKASSSETFSLSDEVSTVETSSFLFKNSDLLLASLLRVEGVFFFFFPFEAEASFPLVSNEKEKLSPRIKVKEKVGHLLANVWQKSKHWDTSAALSSVAGMAVISTVYF